MQCDDKAALAETLRRSMYVFLYKIDPAFIWPGTSQGSLQLCYYEILYKMM